MDLSVVQDLGSGALGVTTLNGKPYTLGLGC